ncbi:pyridoxal phosphate-dependent aminotransferase [Amycolatopsis rubida]|uniref:Aminotransferase n=1 Tax=Amycolatopsis rubida TaxID=112413 RepID=A0A1I5FQC9_9PSEU|nr:MULTISPECIES: pyridoxal phosphate-dependent aminotransferase [Amycolatopsis]MYW92010.1 aminotransferase class I/II-fold pyridoxal phosphate-dependent enzyme [Amycolatopsis rubida]NEC56995.1 pyridoxal phosphate-dependent aminotransferase [Amycolatopsis rubida]OAP27829.1 Aspartate aminotransferase [Amycolatopsis sp. M39]SFO25401.1 Aspartate/methionine/tyrosine aminotransferase [Amycolatopsis rubida]
MVDIGAFGGPALRAGVPPFHVMDVLSAAQARQRSHGDLISLAAGQPSVPAPAAVLKAAQEALAKHTLGYTEQLGIPELREAVAGHYRRTYDVDVIASDVVMTTGSSGGFLLSFLSAFDPGARVAMARPGYPAYRNLLNVLGCEVVEFATTAETNFQPTVEQLDRLGPIDGLIVASPSNPTGTVLPPGELAAISGWCASHGVQLISDEIYHGISYGKQLDCAWQYGREALVLGSFSKYFAMTGWRLGWMLVPQRLHRAVDVLTGNFTICPPAVSQYAAVTAFTPESYAEADAHVEHYRRNRDLLFAGLREIGLDKLAPADGAFYAYADVSDHTTDSLSWCQRLLADTGLAITPGIDFDPVDGGRYVRFSFAGATEDVTEGLRRLGDWLG